MKHTAPSKTSYDVRQTPVKREGVLVERVRVERDADAPVAEVRYVQQVAVPAVHVLYALCTA